MGRLLDTRIRAARAALFFASIFLTASCGPPDEEIDLLTNEYIVSAISNCSKPTAITLSPWNCASEKSSNMIYDADADAFLTGATFSGHPNLECRLPGQTRAVTASRNSWFLS
ncbi:MAG: hypothetical protein KDK33_18275, partial [Leptospiraceae bacterium]|nr:hypothetical protein [Leptospiraceae bacterium]